MLEVKGKTKNKWGKNEYTHEFISIDQKDYFIMLGFVLWWRCPIIDLGLYTLYIILPIMVKHEYQSTFTVLNRMVKNVGGAINLLIFVLFN